MDEPNIFKALKDASKLKDLLRGTGAMQQKLEQLKEELGRKTVEAESGAGAVRAMANGRMEILRVQLDQPLIASLAGEGTDQDQDMIEELIAGAVNAALNKARQMIGQELRRSLGGLDIPGLGDLFNAGA